LGSCKEQSDAITAVKGKHIRSYILSHPIYIGGHMATAELQVGYMPSYRHSSNQNIQKIKKFKLVTKIGFVPH
jgi:hypothetical protein